jgi:hypothetical protein
VAPLKLRLTLDVVYDADPDIYGTDDPAQAAAMDEGEALEMLLGLLDDNDGFDIKIGPAPCDAAA